MVMKQDINELIVCETEKRLNIMQSSDYVFPDKITQYDWVVLISLIVICVLLIGLCMVGVF